MTTSNGMPVMEILSGWISVGEVLPEPKTMCLVWTGRDARVCYYTPNAKFAITALYGTPVTHWMPLPEPPK